LLEQEARAREAEALALAQNDALVELERSHVEIKVKDKVLEQQQREIQALKVCTSTAGGGHHAKRHHPILPTTRAVFVSLSERRLELVVSAMRWCAQEKLARGGSRARGGAGSRGSGRGSDAGIHTDQL
jgi:hypothetical protein